MRRASLILFLYVGEALAHPGHGAVEGHGHGFEYFLLLAIVAALAVFFVKR